jgi:hypothetical protein
VLGTDPGFALKNWGEPWSASVRVADDRAELDPNTTRIQDLSPGRTVRIKSYQFVQQSKEKDLPKRVTWYEIYISLRGER